MKSPLNRNSFFLLIYVIENRSAFNDDLHTYVHDAELHYHHFPHSQNEHELLKVYLRNNFVEEQHICISPDGFNTTKEMFEFC